MKLAIEGHSTQGSEVIAWLKMLGGVNTFNLNGSETNCYYYIDDNDNIYHCLGIDPRNYIYYTLEEFLEKFPYKVGDKVQHKGATSCGSIFEVEEMRWEENTVKYTLCLFGCNYKRSTLPAEYLQPYKEETMEEDKGTLVAIDLTLEFKKANEIEVILGDYEFVLKDGKTYFVKKNKYPKTFIEVLNFWHPDRHLEDDYQRCYKKDLLEKFQDLLYARDAYWKIAGEEMGFDKPWEPDWKDASYKYFICYIKDEIWISNTRDCNRFLSFPTQEMRNAFYENFKDLIEQCKELL